MSERGCQQAGTQPEPSFSPEGGRPRAIVSLTLVSSLLAHTNPTREEKDYHGSYEHAGGFRRRRFHGRLPVSELRHPGSQARRRLAGRSHFSLSNDSWQPRKLRTSSRGHPKTLFAGSGPDRCESFLCFFPSPLVSVSKGQQVKKVEKMYKKPKEGDKQ